MRLLIILLANCWTFSALAFEPEMVRVPGGEFVMGYEDCTRPQVPNECPQRLVRIAPFEIGRYEVTWDGWDACVRDGGCHALDPEKWGKGRRPVINVSWNDAKAYVHWLSHKTGKPYRLPSEAEWEYAARGGTTARYPWGNEEPVCDRNAPNGANIRPCPGRGTMPVGTFRANGFGLYDIIGNVTEWVEDCWHDGYDGAPTDGSAWVTECTDERRVIRGNSWEINENQLRLADRSRNHPNERSRVYGFRVVKTLKAANKP